jgi:diguanylate cyclase (GGDEF)-like protein/PAS domain S-box-containing protein
MGPQIACNHHGPVPFEREKDMTLRKKTLILLSTALLILIVVLYVISKTVILKSYASLEEQNTRAHVQLVLKTLSANISAQESKTGDWANWDDTYDFIKKKSPEYIRINPTDKSFSELKINLMLFINSSGQVVFGKAFDLQTQREIPVPQSIQKHIFPHSLILRHPDKMSRHSGILLLPEGPMIITSRPILTSEGEGPVRGTLVFGRYLDATEIRKMTEESQYSLFLYRIDDMHMPADFISVLPMLSEKNYIQVRPLNSETVGGYTVLNDVYGKPALIMKLVLKRDIFNQGKETVRDFIFLIGITGMILGVITLFVLEKQILSRLTLLSGHIRETGASGDLSKRISVKGKDELSRLSDEMNRMLEALERSEENYRNLFENANDLIQSVDAEGIFLDVNRKWRTVLGYTLDDARQMYFTNIIRKDHIPHCLEWLKRISMGESVDSVETVFVSKDGRELYVEGSINAQHIDGRFICTRGIFRDITSRKQMERTLQESEEKFRMISNTAKDAVIMMDDRGNVTYWNSAAEEIFGYKGDEIIGKELHHVLAPERYLDAYRKGMETFITTGTGTAIGKTVELVGLRKGGGEIPIELSLSAVKLNEKWNAIGIVRDITKRKNLEAKLQDMSYRDELTGLYNRRGFIDLAEQQLKIAERSRKGMLLFFGDLDDMKQINDQYGHQEGDRALKETATLLQAIFRESDIIARIGGDEFVALTLETSTENAAVLLARLTQYFAGRNAQGDLPYALSLSVGVASYDPGHPETIDRLLAQGDKLMYEEKRKRKT